ncbi:hypothetical protein E2C01_011138 [Portunus trituberculatus]|uniref:Uncharacterized protein n=1 Tax=Portunus trituberculatus TaxID=210409 RepID=A0A5B7DAN8_PORTR|nr:hypothetical protein [Portunus trituberculatus]
MVDDQLTRKQHVTTTVMLAAYRLYMLCKLKSLRKPADEFGGLPHLHPPQTHTPRGPGETWEGPAASPMPMPPAPFLMSLIWSMPLRAPRMDQCHHSAIPTMFHLFLSNEISKNSATPASTVPSAAPQLILMCVESDWARKGGHLFLYEKQTPIFKEVGVNMMWQA